MKKIFDFFKSPANLVPVVLGAIFMFAVGISIAKADLTLWYLDGTTLKPVDSSWSIGVAGAAGGSHQGVQFNNGGALASVGSFIFSTSTNTLTLGNLEATSSAKLPSGSSASTTAPGYLGFDTDAWAAGRGAWQTHDGTAATYLLGALVSDTPSNGQVPKWNTGGTITWEADDTAALSGGTANKVTYWTSSSAISANNLFHWDNTNVALGVGSSSPYAKLSVGANTGGSQPMFAVASSTAGGATSTYLWLDAYGNLGLGTTTPGQSALFGVNGGLYAAGAGTFTGALVGTTLDTGQGANELYDMNQNVQTTDAVTFSTVDTGQGANELYDMDQNVLTTSDVVFNSIRALASSTLQLLHSTTFDLLDTGVRFTATDGILTLLGLGNGNDENLTLDLDNGTANTVDFGSGTGVTAAHWGTIGLSSNASSTFSNLNIGTTTVTGAYNFMGTTATGTFRGPMDLAGAQVAQAVASSSCGTTFTVNWLNGNYISCTLGANTTVEMNATSSHPVDGGKYTLRFCQDGTGSRTQSWTSGSGINTRWWNGTTTISTAANSCTYLFMLYDSNSTKYHVVASSTGLQLK